MAAAGSSSNPVSVPDVMNPPAFDINSKGKQKSLTDADTCRICRGEESEEEPLFYPCKCSGSIKFVHQNCLKEWLSHSQKKHCELCKTPFRFTKLYHPHMPNSVPLPIFLRKAALHAWKACLTWSRSLLVVFVWIVWLPWCMRAITRGLFWIGDGGWMNWQKMENQAAAITQNSITSMISDATISRNPPLSTWKNNTVLVLMSYVTNVLPWLAPPTLSGSNSSVTNSVTLGLTKRLLTGDFGGRSSESVFFSTNTTVNSTSTYEANHRSSSLLSGVMFLKSFTRSPALNNCLIDVLEGQIITMLVVVAFILIFLIREWVVQQQPGLNLGVAFNPNPVRPQRVDVPPLNHHGEGERRADEGGQEQASTNQPDEHVFNASNYRDSGIENQDEKNDLSVDRSDVTSQPPGVSSSRSLPNLRDLAKDDVAKIQPFRRSLTGSVLSGSTQRPSLPSRNSFAKAVEVQRALEEHPEEFSYSTRRDLGIVIELWKRAQKHPAEVLRIIEEADLQEELSWIVAGIKGPEVNEQIFPNRSSRLEQLNESDHESQDRKIHNPSIPSEGLHLDFPSSSNGENGRFATSLSTNNEGHLTPNMEQSTRSHVAARDTDRQYASTEVAQEYSNASSSSTNQFDGDDSSPKNINHINNESDDDMIDPNLGATRMEAGMRNHNRNPLDDDPEQHLQTQEASATSHPSEPRLNPGLVDTIMNLLWGGAGEPVDPQIRIAHHNPEDNEQDVDDVAEEAPFIPVENGRPLAGNIDDAANLVQDPEVAAAAAQAGLDPAVDDGDDLEGIMELVGMHGPIVGLIQNAMFCAVLVSMTIFLAVWIPYVAGKVFLVFLANPISLLIKLPLRYASISADVVVDLCLFVAGCLFYWVDTLIRMLCSPVVWMSPPLGTIYKNRIIAETARGYAEDAMNRLAKTFVATGGSMSESDIPVFSIIAHESLRLLEHRFSHFLKCIGHNIANLTSHLSDQPVSLGSLPNWLLSSFATSVEKLVAFGEAKTRDLMASPPWLFKVNFLHVKLQIQKRTTPIDLSLAQWDTKDRVLAILFGYIFFSLVGIIYLRISASFQGKKGQKAEGTLADVLYQAGGVLKVILIISIEMIVFPLYCGLLLDIALLPLFSNVTVMSRIGFLTRSPNTSLFVHWFVGTCYMFHFALFVSMCRKIMRNGVLYFIRDPDDPTFHPVRDVLERNVSTQLRKIAFSALVYGALVILCLGGVVWSIYFSFDNIFPIHWSSNEPVLEFPVDLLFYNFLMPLIIKFFKPSTGLSAIYHWWFSKCARVLRLSHFLLGERRLDEEGRHVRRTWMDWLSRTKGDYEAPVIGDDRRVLAEDRGVKVFFLRDGRYVRAPASDQVRIPKGVNTFVEVDEDGARTDGLPDTDQGLHGRKSDMFFKVYIPPFFRVRIGLFIFFIWLFAALTGVSITIFPLILGRLIFATLLPHHLRMNDIYAFSIGLYVLGGTIYSILRYQQIFGLLRVMLSFITQSTIAAFLRRSATYVARALRVLYTYTSFAVLLPALFSLLIEFYVIIPLHTYFSVPADRHVIHFIQNWTLGVLYVKMLGRLILWNTPSRPATALRAIIRDGWLNPDIRLATRSFIFPASLLMTFALAFPLLVGWIVNEFVLSASAADQSPFRTQVYRYSYPCVLAVCALAGALWALALAFRAWRQRIRDEVYLIDERLHNFGERTGVKAGAGAGVDVGITAADHS